MHNAGEKQKFVLIIFNQFIEKVNNWIIKNKFKLNKYNIISFCQFIKLTKVFIEKNKVI